MDYWYHAAPQEDFTLNHVEINLARIKDKVIFKGCDGMALVGLDLPMPVGTVFRIGGDDSCRTYHIVCAVKQRRMFYYVKRSDGKNFDEHDLIYLKKGSRVLRVGFFYDK